MMKTEEETALLEAYQASLNELDSNCKIKINGLTMVADENKDHAIAIAACIENQLKTVPKQWKLPVLYLIDSICKNFPKSMYVSLFTQNIVSNFCNVFEVSDEKVRKSLHKLRMTWSKTKIFPQKKLNAIDKRVHEMDPNWPILNKLTPGSGTTNTISNSNSIQRQQQIQQQQFLKQEQQQQMLMQQHHEQQHQQQQIFDLIPPQQYITNATQQTNSQPTMLVTTAPQPPQMLYTPFSQPAPPTTQILCGPFDQIQNQPPQPIGPQIICTPFDTIQSQSLGPSLPQPPPPQPLQPQQQPQLQPQQPVPPTSQPAVIQSTTIQQQSVDINQPSHLTVLESLYGGKQCSNCSLRFDDNNKYAIHLDWHFRQNLKNDNMFARRKWYYPLNLWVQFREINDDDLQDNNNSDNNNVNDLLLPTNENEVPTAPASKDDEMNICSVCHETFEKFWAEEEEEWQLKNAKLYDDERVYHPSCLIDMLQASSNEANTSG